MKLFEDSAVMSRAPYADEIQARNERALRLYLLLRSRKTLLQRLWQAWRVLSLRQKARRKLLQRGVPKAVLKRRGMWR